MDREGDTGSQHQGRPGDLRRWTWSGDQGAAGAGRPGWRWRV